jgi:hypothetical protein
MLTVCTHITWFLSRLWFTNLNAST